MCVVHQKHRHILRLRLNQYFIITFIIPSDTSNVVISYFKLYIGVELLCVYLVDDSYLPLLGLTATAELLWFGGRYVVYIYRTFGHILAQHIFCKTICDTKVRIC